MAPGNVQPLAARISRDPDDDVVIATAVAARAVFIVSGDRDLLELPAADGISIVAAVEVLKATR